MILVYDFEGVILTHTVPQRQTVDAQYFRLFFEHNLRPARCEGGETLLAEPSHHFVA